MSDKNIFSKIPENLPEELIETIIKSEKVRVERIISRGHSSPEGFWYDQEQNEFVILLRGKACLLFEDGIEKVILNPGDYLNIPAHMKHRVEWTEKDNETVWLAVFY